MTGALSCIACIARVEFLAQRSRRSEPTKEGIHVPQNDPLDRVGARCVRLFAERRHRADGLQSRQRRRSRDARLRKRPRPSSRATSCSTFRRSGHLRREGADRAWRRGELDGKRRRDGLHVQASPNAKWSNGDPVKAEDFVFSFRRLMNPETGAKYANILYTLKNGEKVNKGQARSRSLGVKAIDDRTLEITLDGRPAFHRATRASDRLPGAPRLGREIRQGLREAREHGVQRRLHAQVVHAERQDRAW